MLWTEALSETYRVSFQE